MYPFTADRGLFARVLGVFGKTTYAVEEGSRINSQTVEVLQATLSPNPSVGGASITIVDGSALSAEQDEIGPGDESKSDQISVYIVRPNDTISGIAKMFGVSVNTIIWANDIKGGIISPGDPLTILPVTGIRIKAKSGDTLAKIAKEHNGNLDEIVSFNNIAANEPLDPGSEVIIPDGEAATKSEVKPATKPKVVGTNKGTAGATASKSYYARPLSGGKKTQGIHGYNGVDLASSMGASVFASAPGKVLIAKNSGYNGGYGNYVVIAHDNGSQTLYAHLKAASVSSGETVTQGQVVGVVGSSGRSTGPHLHFEIRNGIRNPF